MIKHLQDKYFFSSGFEVLDNFIESMHISVSLDTNIRDIYMIFLYRTIYDFYRALLNDSWVGF